MKHTVLVFAVLPFAFSSAGSYAAARVTVGTPSLSVQPAVGPPGVTVAITGSGFSAGEQVDLFIDRVALATATADSLGAFTTASVTIPAAEPPGLHRITARGFTSKLRARAPFTVRTDWASYRWDATHTGSNPFENVLSPANMGSLKQLWSGSTGAAVDSAPAVVGGMVFVGAIDGTLYALDAKSGSLKWATPTGVIGGIRSSPSVTNGKVYITAGESAYAFDAVTGAQLWSAPTGGVVISSPALAHGLVYHGHLDFGRIYALDQATGATMWTADMGSTSISSPTAAGGMVYATSQAGIVRAFDALTGSTIWSVALNRPADITMPVENGTVFFSTYSTIGALDAMTGTPVWTAEINDTLFASEPAVAGGRVFVGSGTGKVYAFDAATGLLDWASPIGRDFATSSATVANGVLYIRDLNGEFYAVDAATGVLLVSIPLEIGKGGSSVTVADGVIYFGSADGTVRAFGLSKIAGRPRR